MLKAFGGPTGIEKTKWGIVRLDPNDQAATLLDQSQSLTAAWCLDWPGK